MNYLRLVALAWRWSWLLVLGFVLGAAGAYGASKMETKVYEATSTIVVNSAGDGASPTYNDVLANQEISKTYASLVRRRPVLEQVERNLNLPDGALNGRVLSTLPRETQLIEIKVQYTDPKLTAGIANEVAKTFITQTRDAQTQGQSAADKDLDSQIGALQVTINNATAERTRLSKPVADLTDAQRQQQLADVNTNLNSLQLTLAGLQKQRQDLRSGLARSYDSVSVAEEATVPSVPVKPRVLLNTILGSGLGLFVALGFVGLLEYMDDSVKTSEDIRQALGTPPVGIVAKFNGGKPNAAGQAAELITSMAVNSTVAESYRMMRTNIETVQDIHAPSSVLVTSAVRGEGKSTTSANLALALAQAGRRVALVDADMRNPSLHHLFNANNSSGLAIYLRNEYTTVDVNADLRTVSEGLFLLPCGPVPSNAAELLSSRVMADIIHHLLIQVDYVILDSPPLLEVSDASVLASKVNGTILVAESGRTRRREIQQAREILHQLNVKVWGVALNKVRVSGRRNPLTYGYGSYGASSWEAMRTEPKTANQP